MAFSAYPYKYFEKPVTIKDHFTDSLFPTTISSDIRELEDLQLQLNKETKQLGQQIIAAQEKYILECCNKLGLTPEELAKHFVLESALEDPKLGAPLPTSSDEYRLVYHFRLVPKRTT